MNLEVMLYVIDLLNNLSNFIAIIMVMLLIAFIIFTVILLIGYAEEVNEDNLFIIKIKKYLIVDFCTLLILGIFNVLIPSQQTLYLMTGIHLSKDIVKSEIGQKTYKLLNQKLDQLLKEDN